MISWWSLGLIHWALFCDSDGVIFSWFDGIFVLNWIHDHKVFDGKFEQEISLLKCCFADCNSVQSIAVTVQSIAQKRFTQFFFENNTVWNRLHSYCNRLHRDRMHFFALFWGSFDPKCFFYSLLLIVGLDCNFKCPICL